MIPIVAVCLIHLSRLKCTKRCISLIQETLGAKTYIFLLIQGPQTDEANRYFETLKTNGITIIRTQKNVGCWGGRKIVIDHIRKFSPNYILILDNDIYLPPNWFLEMEKTWKNAPQKTAAVGMILDYGNQLLGGFDYKIDFSTTTLSYQSIPPPYDKDLVVDACLEGAMMVPLNNLDLIKPDPQLYESNYCGFDILLTIQKQGYNFIICSTFTALHKSNPTVEYTSVRFKKNNPIYYRKFCRKWNLKMNRLQHLKISIATHHPNLWIYLNRLQIKPIKKSINYLLDKTIRTEASQKLLKKITYTLTFTNGILKVAYRGQIFIYLKWILRYFLKGDWTLGTEMAYWEDELYNKRPEGWIEPMHEDILPAIYNLEKTFSEKIRILELGPGPRSRLTEGYEKGLFDLVAVDPLAEDFKKHLQGKEFLMYGYGETVCDTFQSESFHMCYASNVLDHSKNALLCFENMVKLTKIGGFIMVQGNVNEGDRTNWLGIHKYNMWVDDGKLMCKTQYGEPINLVNGLPIKLESNRKTRLEGNSWFSVTYRRINSG